MKRLRYLIIIIFLAISVGYMNGQEIRINDPFNNELPSDRTGESIEAFSRPELRDAPPGGGPGLGEVIIPIRDAEILNLLGIGCVYFAFMLIKKRSYLKKRG